MEMNPFLWETPRGENFTPQGKKGRPHQEQLEGKISPGVFAMTPKISCTKGIFRRAWAPVKTGFLA